MSIVFAAREEEKLFVKINYSFFLLFIGNLWICYSKHSSSFKSGGRVAYNPDQYQIEAIRDMFRHFSMEWVNLGFSLESKDSFQYFQESIMSPLRAGLEIAMHNGRIAPLGTPDVIPFALVMPCGRISLERQYALYGFKFKRKYINYLKMDSIQSRQFSWSPYVITNIFCGRPSADRDPSKGYANRMISGGHRVSLDEALSILKLIEMNPNNFPFKHQAAITGSSYSEGSKIFIPYVDFGNPSGIIFNYTKLDGAICSYRGAMTYEAVLKG